MQLVNACKYLSKFLPPIAFLLGCSRVVFSTDGETIPSYWWYFGAQMLTTIYCLYWDFRWDWGMFIGTLPGRKMLRDEIKFSPRFYYWCMALNFVFRFWWLISMFLIYSTETEQSFIGRLQIYTFLSMLVEAVRRTIWSIIRVENEFFNNFEQYRDIMLIPPIKDD